MASPDDPGPPSPSHITQLLAAAQSGEPRAAAELLPVVYDELRRLASSHMGREPAGSTLQATALVHEAYLRLLGASEVQWRDRGHFFAAAALAMRRILVDRARERASLKRGGHLAHAASDAADTIAAPESTAEAEPVDLLALDRAMDRLNTRDPRQAEVVMLRYFAGLTIEQTAQAMGLSPGTVKNEWTFARAWLRRELESITSA
ncbi:MAG: sigma-70 family RNA polymerase sigma factor [Planctomycetota bacterium]|nr:sigma-70 family RNA polymerase sigma factor [Planctomycetota bacterium]